jgi:hypothetical protein
MNTRESVMALLELVKNRASVEEVYETFYHEDCVSQENLLPPRKGRALSIERQNKVNAALQEIHDFGIGAVLVDGDQSVIQWYFETTTVDGFRGRLDELALHTWKDGKIVHERFFYDASVFQGILKELNQIH